MRKIAIVNMSSRYAEEIAIEVVEPTGTREYSIRPAEAIELDQDEFTSLSRIRAAGGPPGDRFRGKDTGELINPSITPHFRTAGGTPDKLAPPPADEGDAD